MNLVYENNQGVYCEKEFHSILDMLSFLSIGEFTPRGICISAEECADYKPGCQEFYCRAYDILQNFSKKQITMEDIALYGLEAELAEIEAMVERILNQ